MTRKSFFVGGLLTMVLTAAVVGGSFAIFTDQVQSDIQTFQAGDVNINVDDVEDDFTTTFHEAPISMGTGWAPGDHTTQPIMINNTGSLDVIYTVYLDYEYNPGDIWRCDPNGNNLHVWAVNDTGVIASGNSKQVILHAEMPLAAGNACEGKTGDLIVTVHAVQRRNIQGEFECVKLVYKDANTNWRPYGPDDPEGGNWKGQHGNVCYQVDGENHLRVIVNAYDLTPNAFYQLALNGQGGCSNPESQIFAAMVPSEVYHSGWSNGSTTALASSCVNSWDEGVYNFYGTDGELQANGDGEFSLDFTIDGSGPYYPALPVGTTYNNVKFIVKEITGYTGDAPSPSNYGTNWQPMLMEIRTLNFTIP
jgi:predicted ribosomally synthesized peptide with SipW-like signal peptide